MRSKPEETMKQPQFPEGTSNLRRSEGGADLLGWPLSVHLRMLIEQGLALFFRQSSGQGRGGATN